MVHWGYCIAREGLVCPLWKDTARISAGNFDLANFVGLCVSEKHDY